MESTINRNKTMFTLREIGEILGSVREGDSEFPLVPVAGIEIDSRRIHKGDLFIAVKGENRDGHDFVESAFSNGAVAAVVSKKEIERKNLRDRKFIAVDDTIFALGELARRYRKLFKIDVVAVTGSNGKTTVKNLIYEILSRNGQALKSEKNFNNFFGLPLSIFRLTDHHKSAVFELGMSAPGEIARLGEIVSPDVAVITNVGPAHLEFFGSVEKIAEAKLEIQKILRKGGTLVINGDDDLLARKVDKKACRIRTFGLGEQNEIRPESLTFDEKQLPKFSVGDIDVRSNLPGIHNVYNLLAAIAVSRVLGIDSLTTADALSGYSSKDLRSEIVSKKGITFIVDCYNANPVSMKYAIDTLSAMNCRGRRIAVLGDMLELGKNSDDYHREIGRYARKKAIDAVFCHGPLSRHIAESFGENACHFPDKKEMSHRISNFLKSGDIALFKASRGIALEQVFYEVLGAI